MQPALFAVEVALAALWRAWGIEPDAVVGHSMGEVAAAHVAGALSLADAARVIALRSRLLARIAGQGGMAAVELSLDDTRRALVGRDDKLCAAASNSARSTVISGDAGALADLLADLERRGVYCRRLKVDVAFHSPQVDALRADLQAGLEGIAPRSGDVAFYSTVTGTLTEGESLGPEYWVRNLREPVLFAAALGRLGDGRVRRLRGDESSPRARRRRAGGGAGLTAGHLLALGPARRGRARGHARVARLALGSRLPGGLGSALPRWWPRRVPAWLSVAARAVLVRGESDPVRDLERGPSIPGDARHAGERRRQRRALGRRRRGGRSSVSGRGSSRDAVGDGAASDHPERRPLVVPAICTLEDVRFPGELTLGDDGARVQLVVRPDVAGQEVQLFGRPTPRGGVDDDRHCRPPVRTVARWCRSWAARRRRDPGALRRARYRGHRRLVGSRPSPAARRAARRARRGARPPSRRAGRRVRDPPRNARGGSSGAGHRAGRLGRGSGGLGAHRHSYGSRPRSVSPTRSGSTRWPPTR